MPEFKGALSLGNIRNATTRTRALRLAIAVGMWLAIDDSGRRGAGLWSVALAVPASRPSPSPEPTRRRSPSSCTFLASDFAAVPWAATMLLGALHFWPARGFPGTGWLERLGVASYEVFLVQVVWLGVLQDRGLMHFLVAALASGVLGWALHRVPTATPVGPLGLRRGALARS